MLFLIAVTFFAFLGVMCTHFDLYRDLSCD